MSANRKSPVKPGQMLIAVNQKNAFEACDQLSEMTLALSQSLRRDNPIDRLVIDIIDGSHYIEDDYEQCAACEGKAIIESLEWEPYEVTVEAITRLIERGLKESRRLNESAKRLRMGSLEEAERRKKDLEKLTNLKKTLKEIIDG